MSRAPLRVCDHVLLRFIERIGGVDIEKLRGQLQASLNRAVTTAEAIGAAEMVVVADGMKYIIVKNVLVTVLDQKMTPKRIKGEKK